MDRTPGRRIGRSSVRQGQPSGAEHSSNPIFASTAVDQAAVIMHRIESHHRPGAARQHPEHLVEHLAPRPGVHTSGVGHDPVHVEDRRANDVGEDCVGQFRVVVRIDRPPGQARPLRSDQLSADDSVRRNIGDSVASCPGIPPLWSRALADAGSEVTRSLGLDAVASELQRGLKTRAAASLVGWNHGVGTHHVPPDSISNAGLTEELDQRIGTAAAHAVRNVPLAKPEEHVGSVFDGMRGSTFDSAVVVAVCTNGRLVGLAPIERLLAAPADAVMADLMDSDPPAVALCRVG